MLPVLILALSFLVYYILGLFGADCHGDWLDGPWVCNELGEVQHSLGWGGWMVAALSVPIWALGMAVVGVRSLKRRRSGRLN